MKKKLVLAIFSLSFFLVWGMAFLDVSADQFSAFLGIIYTVFATYFVNKKFDFSLKLLEKILVLSMPFLYLMLFTFIQGRTSSLFFLINPFLISFILLCLMLTSLKDISNKNNFFVVAFVTTFYIYCLFPDWKHSRRVKLTENFDTEVKNTRKKDFLSLNDTINLKDFSFINKDLDTITLNEGRRFILLETWNETCFPCIKAFKDMPPFYNANKTKLDYHYVYEHPKQSVREKFDKIFNFKRIINKSKILIDINQKMYKETKMGSYPYFLLFNKRGNLVFYQRGYNSSQRSILEKKILQFIKEDKDE